jgi:hypothetical protein
MCSAHLLVCHAQAIHRLVTGADPTVTLTQYIVVFGAFNLIIAQVLPEIVPTCLAGALLPVRAENS